MSPIPSPDPRPKATLSPSLIVFTAALFIIPRLRTEIHFHDDRGLTPPPFELTLTRHTTTHTVPVKNGRICLLRGRWHLGEISDLQFIRQSFTPQGTELHIPMERNLILKLRDAANSQPSVAQNRDPQPHPYE